MPTSSREDFVNGLLRSYAVSFWEWITDSAREFGYRVADATLV